MSTLTQLARRCFPAIGALLIGGLPAFGQTSPLAGANTIGVFRGVTSLGNNLGEWIVNASGTHIYQGSSTSDPVFYFGLASDQPVVGNWTGTSPAVLQVGVFRNGYWYLDWNNNQTWDAFDAENIPVFGLPGDIPVVGDWNHDGNLHIGVVRVVGGSLLWYVQTGCASGAAVCNYDPNYTAVFNWGLPAELGLPGDLPVVGDWDQTGVLRIGVDRAGTWIVNLSKYQGDVVDSNGYPGTEPLDYADPWNFSWQGSGTGTPVVGNWGPGYLSEGTFNQGTWSVVDENRNPYATWYYGMAGDVPVVGPWSNSSSGGPTPPTTPNALSITVSGNNEGSAGGALPGVMASFAFTFYDTYYGASGIDWGQIYLATNSGSPQLCNLGWGVCRGLYQCWTYTTAPTPTVSIQA